MKAGREQRANGESEREAGSVAPDNDDVDRRRTEIAERSQNLLSRVRDSITRQDVSLSQAYFLELIPLLGHARIYWTSVSEIRMLQPEMALYVKQSLRRKAKTIEPLRWIENHLLRLLEAFDRASRSEKLQSTVTGWVKVDSTMAEAQGRLNEAKSEEQFQTVGLLCREALISLAQAVYDPEKHPSIDGVVPSKTDCKRMLAAYLAVAVPGATNEAARKHQRAAVDLAVELQHRRTATYRDAALCVEATKSVINMIAITSGMRDLATG